MTAKIQNLFEIIQEMPDWFSPEAQHWAQRLNLLERVPEFHIRTGNDIVMNLADVLINKLSDTETAAHLIENCYTDLEPAETDDLVSRMISSRRNLLKYDD